MIRRFTIGRDRTTDIPVADESVSRFHAEIWLTPDGELVLADRGSSNGTELIRNGQISQLTQGAVLPSDEVRLGAATFVVKDLIEAIEIKYPGGLTRLPEHAAAATFAPPPLPSPAPASHAPAGFSIRHPAAPPPLPSPPAVPPGIASGVEGRYPPVPPPLPPAPPGIASGVVDRYPPAPARPPVPPPLSSPPPLPGSAQSPPRVPDNSLVRCDCGALKTLGQACPRCHKVTP
jgi:hypothetical protein